MSDNGEWVTNKDIKGGKHQEEGKAGEGGKYENQRPRNGEKKKRWQALNGEGNQGTKKDKSMGLNRKRAGGLIDYNIVKQDLTKGNCVIWISGPINTETEREKGSTAAGRYPT